MSSSCRRTSVASKGMNPTADSLLRLIKPLITHRYESPASLLHPCPSPFRLRNPTHSFLWGCWHFKCPPVLIGEWRKATGQSVA